MEDESALGKQPLVCEEREGKVSEEEREVEEDGEDEEERGCVGEGGL